MLLSEVSPSSSCGEKPKRKKKNHVPLSVFFLISYPIINLKRLGDLTWFVICCLWFVVLGYVVFLREAKERVFDGTAGAGQEPAGAAVRLARLEAGW